MTPYTPLPTSSGQSPQRRRSSLSFGILGHSRTRSQAPDPDEMDRAFDGPEHDDDDDHDAHEGHRLLGADTTAHNSTSPQREAPMPGDYDFDRDYVSVPLLLSLLGTTHPTLVCVRASLVARCSPFGISSHHPPIHHPESTVLTMRPVPPTAWLSSSLRAILRRAPRRGQQQWHHPHRPRRTTATPSPFSRRHSSPFFPAKTETPNRPRRRRSKRCLRQHVCPTRRRPQPGAAK